MNSTTGLGRKHACLIVKFYIKSDRWKKVSAVTNHMSAPVISLTVRNTSKFLASSGGMFLKSSLWRKKTKNYYKHTKCMALYPEMHTDSYPIIPVTRKWRLPWILVQLMKLLMLLESTVCLSSAPVPSHTTGMTRNNHIWQLRSNLGGRSEKSHLYSFQPFGQSPLQSSHFLWPSFSTSILSDGQALTQELPSTTKWAVRRRKKRKTQGICLLYTCRGANKIKWFTIQL